MASQKRVLIISRSAAGKLYLGVLLKRIWYAPLLVSSAEEGARQAKDFPVDLVLLDGDLDETALISAVTLLRNDRSVNTLPLVVCTTRQAVLSEEALIARGASAVLIKPLDLAIVYGVLGRLTGEPRQTPRATVRLRVEIEEGTPEKELTCINLSEGGMYLRTLSPLPHGTVLHVRFRLPRDTEGLRIEAEVVRAAQLAVQIEAEPGMGVRFVNIPEEVALRIRNFIQWELIGDLEWEPDL